MANRPSRLVVPAYLPSYDGRYHLRYPHGDKPDTGALLEAQALARMAAAGNLSAAIRLAASGQAVAGMAGGISTAVRLAAAAASRVSATASFGASLFVDNFDYSVARNQSQASAIAAFQAGGGWNTAGLSNGTGQSHGFLYTAANAPGYSGGTFTSGNWLIMESYPNNGSDTSFLQADYYLQHGAENGNDGFIPPDLWTQFEILLVSGTYPSRNKFLYPVRGNVPTGNTNPENGPITTGWLFMMGRAGFEAAPGPAEDNYICLQAYGAVKNTSSPDPTNDNKLHQNMSSKRIVAGVPHLVRFGTSIAGANGRYIARVKALGESNWTTVAHWEVGVTPNFAWDTYAEMRIGHRFIRTPTTENADPVNNPLRNGNGDHMKAIRHLEFAATEADLTDW